MKFRVETKGFLLPKDGSAPDPDTLDTLSDAIQDELLELEGVIDPDLGITLRTGEIHLRTCVEAETPEQAIGQASGAFRSALHAAGIGTPGWEDDLTEKYEVEEVAWQVEKVSDADQDDLIPA